MASVLTRRWLVVLLTGLAAVWAACPARAADPAGRPNVVLIMADDMGYSDIGCFGSEIATPNLDRLAAGGLRMTQFYNTARCCPTRASLLTGLYSHQAGIGLMVGDFGTPGYRGFLSDQCATIAEVLTPAGYHPLMSGKWHVGEQHPHWPMDRGFEHYWGLISGASNYFKIDPERTLANENEKITTPPGPFYLTDAITDHAVKYVDEYGKKPEPFFLYLAYTAPHWPLHAPAETIEKHRGKYKFGWDALRERRHRRQIELGIVDARWPLTPRDEKAPAWENAEDKDLLDLKMAVYAAQIEKLDDGVGRVMAKLKELGIEQNTLVIFLADNGGCAEAVNRGANKDAPPGGPDSFMSYGLPWANASNTPFRLYKHWVHEGGIATPFIAYWPAVIRPGQLNTSDVGHAIDLSATIYDVAGATYPKERGGKQLTPIEGKSLLPILKGGHAAGPRTLFWEHEGHRAVRQGDWKLVAREDDHWELYNLVNDRTETSDLAAKNPDKVKELRTLWEEWATRANVLDKGKRPRKTGGE
jgi:arylsulfatase